MIIAYALIIAGVFALAVYFKNAAALAVQWRDVTRRRRRIFRLIGMTPFCLLGVFLIAYMGQALLWYYGSSVPTAVLDFPDSNHGEIRYVSGALRQGLWMLSLGSMAVLALPAALAEVVSQFRCGRRALRAAVRGLVGLAAPRP